MLAQLLVVPDAVVWAAAYLAGPGFAVGTATSVDPGGTVLGPLPALPLFGALPVPGANPVWLWALLAVPVLAGVVGGRARDPRRAGARRSTQWATDAAGSGALAGAGLGAARLAGLGTGRAGADGRPGTGRRGRWRSRPRWRWRLGALLAVAALAAVRRGRRRTGRLQPRRRYRSRISGSKKSSIRSR